MLTEAIPSWGETSESTNGKSTVSAENYVAVHLQTLVLYACHWLGERLLDSI